jgi:Flp pilus assembly protein TadG
MRKRKSAQRGATLIEFALVTLLLMIILFAGIEFNRMVLVYTALANSARVGVRYAIVHGSDRTTTAGSDPASSQSDPTAVVTKVKQFASVGMLDTSALRVDVVYPVDNKPGSLVKVKVTYPYDPWVVLPLHVNLTSATQGIIVF